MTNTDLPAYEKLGAFYLGRAWDLTSGETGSEPILYDAKDLVTHAVCVGMTGSGKTGLCVDLLEEAAIDGIPSLVIDVKGDMGNLLLHFPELAPADFEPWIDPGEAQRAGKTVSEHAATMAEVWRGGIAKWDQDEARIKRLAESADFAIYTPGGDAGLKLTVLRSFSAPSEELRGDRELFADRIQSAVAGLLSLLDSKLDPLQSREAVLLANLLEHHWRKGADLDLAGLIHGVQAPPFERLGVLDLETFYPSKDRTQLALSLNSLLASPGFQSWLEGEPLDIQRLLWTEEGKPRVSVVSIAHLSDTERMFFVTVLLNEVVSWMRAQSGTGSLRAILYMDEIFGYFPPTAQPPSKKPMLTLLKQARAFGVGVVLATQNPVDLDYKGLANTGTWFLGRMQTERDKLRVLDGLEGAMATGGKSFDRKELDAMLSGLGKRVFLLHNVHEDQPVLFQTRFALNYLRGPLDRAGIARLMEARKAAEETRAAEQDKEVERAATEPAAPARPALPGDVPEAFEAPSRPLPGGTHLVYRPTAAAEVRLHFTRASLSVDRWESRFVRAPLHEDEEDPAWDDGEVVRKDQLRETDDAPCDGSAFAPLPAAAQNAKVWKSWSKQLVNHAYQTQAMTFWRTKKPKLVSKPGEPRGDFMARLDLALREERDAQVDTLKDRYASKFRTLEDRIRRARARVEKEEQQLAQAKKDKWMSIGKTLVGSLFGRKRSLSSTVSKSGKVSKEKLDIEKAVEEVQAQEQNLLELERELQDEVAELEQRLTADAIDLEETLLRPKKSDIEVRDMGVRWRPFAVSDEGKAQRL